MHPLSTQELLRAWERGHAHDMTNRALLLLAQACPDEEWQDLAALPIGSRDSRLLTLREWAFGSTLSSLASCPVCDSALELTFAVADVRTAPIADGDPLRLRAHEYEIDVRLPDSTDLASVTSLEEGRHQLLSRCILHASHRGQRVAAEDLPDDVIDAVVARIGDADPQAMVATTLTCPDCGHPWQAVFDIASFLWEEVEQWARRTLRDVHALASSYGWNEDDILTLSPWRRQQYLQLVHR